MNKLKIFISAITENYMYNEHYYTFHGDGVGDFEKLADGVEDVQLLHDYEAHLETQMRIVKELLTPRQMGKTFEWGERTWQLPIKITDRGFSVVDALDSVIAKFEDTAVADEFFYMITDLAQEQTS